MRWRGHVAQNERKIHVQVFGEGTQRNELEDIFVVGKIILKLGEEKQDEML
jgi:hypothetical protein